MNLPRSKFGLCHSKEDVMRAQNLQLMQETQRTIYFNLGLFNFLVIFSLFLDLIEIIK